MVGTHIDPVFQVEYVLLAGVVLLCAGAVLAWKTTSRSGLSVRLAVLMARTVGLLGLVVIALNPGDWVRRVDDASTETAVLVDRSISMGEKDAEGESRWNRAVETTERLLKLADETSRVRLYTFSGDVEDQAGEDISSLRPDGETTDITGACRSILARAGPGGVHLKALVLLSDGRQVVSGKTGDLAMRAQAVEAPFYAVAYGGNVVAKDIVVSPIRRQYVSFKGQKVSIGVDVRATGMGKIRPVARLLDSSGNEVAVREIDIEGDAAGVMSFELAGENAGSRRYDVVVDEWPGECSVSNNRCRIDVTTLDGRIRALMVEGIPFWDSKFLAQLLRQQANMELTSIYRLSSSRYFRVETDADSVSDSVTPIFPDSAEALGEYDVVLCGKGMEYFLDVNRIKLLRSFVRDRGGCLVFARGKPYSGQLPELEELEPVVWGERLPSEFAFTPATAGEDAGLFGFALAGIDDPVWKRLPPLGHATRCKRTRAFARVLVEGEYQLAGRKGLLPLVVSSRFGKGLIVTVNAEGFWKWDFFPAAGEAGNMYREFWTQLVQWAVTYSDFLPGQMVSVRLDATSVKPGEPVMLRITRRGNNVSNHSAPLVRVLGDDGLVQETSAAPTGETGAYGAVLTVEKAGTYSVAVFDGNGTAMGGVSPVFHVRRPPAERDNLSADPAFLAELTEDSGGALLGADEIVSEMAGFLTRETVDESDKAIWMPVWDKWWFLCIIALCFGLEWFLRRRNGLL